MPIPTDLPTDKVAGQPSHDVGHNVTNARVNDIAAAANAEAALHASSFGLSSSSSAAMNATNLVALFTAAAAAGVDVLFDRAGTFPVGAGLTWNSHRHSVTAVADVFLDFSSMTSGTALSVIGQNGATGVTNSLNGTSHRCEGITLIGPDGDSATVDGVRISDTTGAAMVTLRGMRVVGFRDNLTFGNNVWLSKFYNCTLSKAHRYGIDLTPGTNSGENVSFFGCVVHNSHNATNTAVGVFTTLGTDAYFYGCSFDYNDIEIWHKGGKLVLSGGHIENGKATSGSYVGNPMIKVTRVVGQARTTLSLVGVQVSPTEHANGVGTARDHLIEATSDSGNDAYITCIGCDWATYDESHTIFKSLSASVIQFSNRGGMWDNTSADGTRSTTMGVYSSVLVNGDGEIASTFPGPATAPYYPGKGWGVAGSANTTWSFNTANQRSGARCISVVGAAGNVSNTACANAFAVLPGYMLQWTGWVEVPTYTSGTLSFRVHWYYDDYTTRQVVAYQRDFTAVQSTWVPVTSRLLVPPGIRLGLLDLQQNAFIGTAYLDDVTAHIT